MLKLSETKTSQKTNKKQKSEIKISQQNIIFNLIPSSFPVFDRKTKNIYTIFVNIHANQFYKNCNLERYLYLNL